MRNYLSIALILIVSLGCNVIDYVRGNGEISSEKRLLDDFSKISLRGNYEIGLKKGPRSQIVIVTDSNLLEYIDTQVENEVLVVESIRKISSDNGIKIYITYQELESLKSAGASVINTEGPITSERFELEVPGAGLVDLEVDVTDLEIMLAGAGLVKIKGRAENQNVSLNGVGNLKAFDLESRFCEVTVSGMGGAEINVKENLLARVNGVGSIKYRGNPKKVDEKVSGVGTIRADDSMESPDNTGSI